jgi:hypothetical protein
MTIQVTYLSSTDSLQKMNLIDKKKTDVIQNFKVISKNQSVVIKRANDQQVYFNQQYFGKKLAPHIISTITFIALTIFSVKHAFIILPTLFATTASFSFLKIKTILAQRICLQNNLDVALNAVKKMGTFTTKEADEAHINFRQQHFGRNLSLTIIFTITFIAFSILSTKSEFVILPTLLATTASFGFLKLKSLLNQRLIFKNQINKELAKVKEIYNDIKEFINNLTKLKHEHIQNLCYANKLGGFSFDQYSFPKFFEEKCLEYDNDKKQKPCADRIKSIDKLQNPGISESIWDDMQNACKEYLSCTNLYNDLYKMYVSNGTKFST